MSIFEYQNLVILTIYIFWPKDLFVKKEKTNEPFERSSSYQILESARITQGSYRDSELPSSLQEDVSTLKYGAMQQKTNIMRLKQESNPASLDSQFYKNPNSLES